MGYEIRFGDRKARERLRHLLLHRTMQPHDLYSTTYASLALESEHLDIVFD